MNPYSLSYLLAPCATVDFARHHWGVSLLTISRNLPDYFDEIITDNEVSSALQRRSIRQVDLVIVNRQEETEHETYTVSLDSGRFKEQRFVDPGLLANALGKGALVRFEQPEHQFHKVDRLLEGLSRELGFPTTAKISYHTTRFAAINERIVQPCFVLQVSGTSQWTTEKEDERQESTATLSPGDLLYLPGGATFSIEPGSSAGTWLSISLFAPRWVNLLEELLKEARQDPDFRKRVTPNDVDDPVKVERMKHFLVNAADWRRQVNALQKRSLVQLAEDHTGRLLDHVQLKELSISTLLETRYPNSVPNLAGDRVEIPLPWKTLRLASVYQNQVEYICRTNKFKIADLGGDFSAQSEWVRQLIKEGFLRIVG